MTRTLKKTVPKVAFLGLTLEFTRTYPDFTPGTDTATLHLRSSTGLADIVATASDGAFKFHVSDLAADTGTLAGETELFINIAQGSDEILVEEGMIDIKADPSAATAADFRSDTKKILDAIRATLLGNAGIDQLSYSISTSAGTRSLSRVPRDELTSLEREYSSRYRTELRKARKRAGKRGGNVVKSRMSRRG